MQFLDDLKSMCAELETRGRLSWHEYFASLALLVSARSPCQRLHVGCAIVRENRVLCTGYNGFFSGVPHRSIFANGHEQATVHAEVLSFLLEFTLACNSDVGQRSKTPLHMPHALASRLQEQPLTLRTIPVSLLFACVFTFLLEAMSVARSVRLALAFMCQVNDVHRSKLPCLSLRCQLLQDPCRRWHQPNFLHR